MDKSILLVSQSDNQIDELLASYTGEISELLSNVRVVLYVPYASDEDWDVNTQKARDFFNSLGVAIVGAHQVPNHWPITDFDAICVGDGNIEHLSNEIEERNLSAPLKLLINSGKVRYIGIGAGAELYQTWQ